MSAMVSEITGLPIVYSTACSGAYQRKHQSFASLAFVMGNPPVTGGFPSQSTNNAENVSIWWPLIASFMGSTWGPSGADRTQVGSMLAPWTLLSGTSLCMIRLHVCFRVASLALGQPYYWWILFRWMKGIWHIIHKYKTILSVSKHKWLCKIKSRCSWLIVILDRVVWPFPTQIVKDIVALHAGGSTAIAVFRCVEVIPVYIGMYCLPSKSPEGSASHKMKPEPPEGYYSLLNGTGISVFISNRWPLM